MEVKKTDVLIIGNGLTGIRAAAEASAHGVSVSVLCKGPCASVEIMGFDAPVRFDDSVDLFCQDIMKSGCWINSPKLAMLMAKNSLNEAASIESIGLSFSKTEDGSYSTIKPLGCSVPRLISVQSYTGKHALEAYKQIAEQNGCEFFYHTAGYQLVCSEGRVIGAIAINLDTGLLTCFLASAVIMATGGCGKVYPMTTYPRGIDGDGYAMAYRAGAELIDMEFMQFEPCCFLKPDSIQGAVAVTTMLLEGGKLLNGVGQEFISGGYQMQKSKLAYYIEKEIREGHPTENGGVYYDVTALPWKRVAVDHAVFYNPAKDNGLDITKEAAEVRPMAHTCVGGIRISERCESSLPGLFAAGEVAGGVHGANRIGGCAGTETLVFGQNAGYWAAVFARNNPLEFSGEIEEPALQIKDGHDSRKAIVSIRAKTVNAIASALGLIKREDELLSLLALLEGIEEEIQEVFPESTETFLDKIQLENQLLIAKMQAEASLLRKESRGVFFRADYPDECEDYRGSIIISKKNQTMDFTFVRAGSDDSIA